MRVRTSLIGLLIAVPSIAVLAPGSPASTGLANFAERYQPWEKTDAAGNVVAPPTANPYTANLADDEDADYRSWNAFAAHGDDGDNRDDHRRKPRIRTVRERNRNNDTPRRAQWVPFRTGKDRGGVDIAGRGPSLPPGTLTDIGAPAEPFGSYGDAVVLPDLELGDSVVGAGVIGDDGDDFDFDFFRLDGLSAGETIVFDVDTPVPFDDLDSFIAIFDGFDMFPLAENDDSSPDSFDSRLTFDVPADGSYWLMVAGFGAFIPADPTDPNSESVTGDPGSQGDYSFRVDIVEFDVDYYRFRAKKGDVLGVTVFGGAAVEFLAPDRSLLIGSAQDLTFIHPPSSPLPGGGDASASYVLERSGTHWLGVRTTGDYRAELRGFRPLGDSQDRGTQILFLDFDGASLDPGIFFGGPFGFEVPLSPLSSYLPAWGLGPGAEDAVIDAIVASVEENLDHDIDRFGLNDEFDIEIRNSRDHPDPWGQPHVSRIIVGGGIEELGIETIGIAQSIDVGNFETQETAVTLLDILSGTGPFPLPELDLNNIPRAPGVSIVQLIGVTVGGITAHEGGHFFANWHTDQFNDQPNIQDQGGNLPVTIIGIGDDGVFGTADDVDVDFGDDVFVPGEGFTGVEDTLNSIGFGLWSDDDHDDDDDDD